MQTVIRARNLHITRGEEARKTTFCDQELTQKHCILKDQAVLLDPRLCQRCCNIPSTPCQFLGILSNQFFRVIVLQVILGHVIATWV